MTSPGRIATAFVGRYTVSRSGAIRFWSSRGREERSRFAGIIPRLSHRCPERHSEMKGRLPGWLPWQLPADERDKSLPDRSKQLLPCQGLWIAFSETPPSERQQAC